jgi:hypothetical protein
MNEGDKIKNIRTGKIGIIVKEWPYIGPDSQWKETQMYWILINSQYQYLTRELLERRYEKLIFLKKSESIR